MKGNFVVELDLYRELDSLELLVGADMEITPKDNQDGSITYHLARTEDGYILTMQDCAHYEGLFDGIATDFSPCQSDLYEVTLSLSDGTATIEATLHGGRMLRPKFEVYQANANKILKDAIAAFREYH